jgi:hypothetical protein
MTTSSSDFWVTLFLLFNELVSSETLFRDPTDIFGEGRRKKSVLPVTGEGWVL